MQRQNASRRLFGIAGGHAGSYRPSDKYFHSTDPVTVCLKMNPSSRGRNISFQTLRTWTSWETSLI